MSFDAVAPSVCAYKMMTARKDHKCCECHGPIVPGEKYQLVKGCWDGHWGHFKTCALCVDLRAAIQGDDPDGEPPPFEYLKEAASEYGYDFPPKKD